jgi:predicted flavoprotein YhiN
LKHTAKLSKAAITLLKHYLTKEEFTNREILAQTIKNFPIHITALAPLDEAISSVGGVDLSEINEHFEFKKWQHHYAIGEMLDWDAPTGGYLITGCYAQASYLANYLNNVFSETQAFLLTI